MISFKPIELEDGDWVQALINNEGSKSADFNFANMFIWENSFKQKFARINERLIVMSALAERPFFVFPVGTGDIVPVILKLKEYSDKNGFNFNLKGVTAPHVTLLDSAFPGKFHFYSDRNYFDYIYSAQKLASLTGKKLSAKRNHINRFTQENDWSFEPFSPDHIPECNRMLDLWEKENNGLEHSSLQNEHRAILRAFKYFDALGLEGGILRVNNIIVAFTLGSRLTADTFSVCFEKAFSHVQGAYPMINREFVRYIISKYPEIEYINREDDMGIENLRRSKMSYRPEWLLEKYTAEWIYKE